VFGRFSHIQSFTFDYPHVAQRLFNAPLVILPGKAEIVMAALADCYGIAVLSPASGEPVTLAEFDSGAPAADDRFYDVVEGIAVIPVTGTLFVKSGCMVPYSGITGYDGIRACLSLALADAGTRTVVLDIDSPGSEVAGCFYLVDEIYAARGDKPILAFLSESAYSAAYAIACACDWITVPRTGGTGSVGVIALHTDFSKALSGAGIAVTIIQYGDRKADGYEFQAPAPEAFARFQADIDAMGDLFVATVARNRSLSANAVRATEAATFLGAARVEIGFDDAVMAPEAPFRALLAEQG
jgi:capsid assembly protease